MHRRSQYVVKLDPIKAGQAGLQPELQVFSDEISVTNTGIIIFNQVRAATYHHPDGKTEHVNAMQPVLFLAADIVVAVYQTTPEGRPLYIESGMIQTKVN